MSWNELKEGFDGEKHGKRHRFARSHASTRSRTRRDRGIEGTDRQGNREQDYSHTAPSPSPPLMYRYAGCERGTGAIPCRLASAQVILPFRLSS